MAAYITRVARSAMLEVMQEDYVRSARAKGVPWRVVINECIELAKAFGGTDGHKYVNGVLNAVAPELRALEVEADRQRS